MNILIVSECRGQALIETRRILDQFAERKGERTWITPITQEGLNTLRKLLRKNARRNTAVACHWLKKSGQNALLWIVGKASCFNEEGSVPTNKSGRDILKSADENQWQSGEVIALLASLAGLFHDFGKANVLFQQKLAGKNAKSFEPCRHEWVSLRLFQAFVQGKSDQEWLSALTTLTEKSDALLLTRLREYQEGENGNFNHGKTPFADLGNIAQSVAWLIVSHHRLPEFYKKEDEPTASESAFPAAQHFNASWNSPQCLFGDWRAKDWQNVWQFPQGTPIKSAKWRDRARILAQKALNHPNLWRGNKTWLDDRFTTHLARLSLMLADHTYSSESARIAWQDGAYAAYANTDFASQQLKQKLDEHNLGVAHYALQVARRLPQLKNYLPAITRHKGFKKCVTNEAFRWQDKAYELALSLSDSSKEAGFFGVNMASTGCGKTFANARIMYALADEKKGCRFSVALGLRTLTLQTGDALRARLGLDEDDLAVLIGSSAVQQLHELNQEQNNGAKGIQNSGSESAEQFFDDNQYVHYEGALADSPLRRFIKRDSKADKLISAPVLVCTIDHLMPSTEGARGGRQIAPMLRLLTSDLVLDEPDDFDLADLPALCRLVNWAGMLGARVLLSSATLPPALISALFLAYQAGRKHFNDARGLLASAPICVAWFDEFGCMQQKIEQKIEQKADQKAEQKTEAQNDFLRAHEAFVGKRIAKLDAQALHLRQASLLPTICASKKTPDVINAMANAIYQGIFQLHETHHQTHATGKTLSIGLVRMANIKQLVALAQNLLKKAPPENTHLHFCVYHSKHPHAVRSNMEKELDQALNRHDFEALWDLPAMKKALQSPLKNHVFVVFASPVAEVGRDHDYDWAIAEPSSMRSIIQLAGRVQRHRQKKPSTPNMLILERNFQGLKEEKIAFSKPGFESGEFCLASHHLVDLLTPEEYAFISAKPRILAAPELQAKTRLVDLEHAHLQKKLFGTKDAISLHAALWWEEKVDWCNQMQRKTRFRQSRPEELFVLYQAEADDAPVFYSINEDGGRSKNESQFTRTNFVPAERVSPWINNDIALIFADLAARLEENVATISVRFGIIHLAKRNDVKTWGYDPLFGVHELLE